MSHGMIRVEWFNFSCNYYTILFMFACQKVNNKFNKSTHIIFRVGFSVFNVPVQKKQPTSYRRRRLAVSVLQCSIQYEHNTVIRPIFCYAHHWDFINCIRYSKAQLMCKVHGFLIIQDEQIEGSKTSYSSWFGWCVIKRFSKICIFYASIIKLILYNNNKFIVSPTVFVILII